MTTNNTELLTAASAWTALPIIQRDMANWTAEQRDGFLQALINRVEFIKDAVSPNDFRVTSIGELQIKGINKTGAASVDGTLLVPDLHHVIGGTTYATADAVTGITSSNSTGGRLYLSIAVVGGFGTVLVFSDAAQLNQVAHGALGDNLGGAAALTADGGSGIGGSITLEAGCPAVADTGGYIDAGTTGGWQKAAIDDVAVCAVCAESGIADGSSMWITIPGGTAQVLAEATATFARGQYVRSGSTTSGSAEAEDSIDVARQGQYIGRSIGRKEAGVGTTCGILFTGASLEKPSNVKKLTRTVTTADFSGLAALDKDTDVSLGQLPQTARLLGIVVWPSFLFQSPGGGAITLSVGVAADHDGWTTAVDVCSATGSSNPKDGMTGAYGIRYLQLPADYDLRVYIDAADDLNTFTAGSVTVEIFYEVTA